MTTSPLQCHLNVFNADEQQRYAAVRAAMKRAARETRELPDGYAVRLLDDPIVFKDVAEWITLERRCCPFLSLGLTWSEDDAVWLSLTGGSEVKAFLAQRLSAAS